jgi:Fic family protein
MNPFVPNRLPLENVEWESHIPLISQVNRSIAQYDGVLYGIPNTDVLFSPLTTQEAVLSSRIEGTVATLSEVFKFQAGEQPEDEGHRSDEMQEIVNYRRALYLAEMELRERPFTLNLLLELHHMLLDSVRGKDKGRGQFRKTQNWIGTPECRIEEADFVPPPPSLVMENLSNWEKYYHLQRPDPLVQLAILHAQFEIIHPFIDGNGRIGRLLIPIFLFEKGIISRPMFYLSSYFERYRNEYIYRLRSISQEKDAWNQWIMFFLKALDEQSHENTSKARAILDLYEKMKHRLVEVTHSQYAVMLLDKMFEHPIFRSGTSLFPETPPCRALVTRLLWRLKDANILRVIREGRGARPPIYAFSELINLCEGREVL